MPAATSGAPRDAALIIATVRIAVHAEAPPPTATARALEPRMVRSERWRPMPADTMAMSRSTASLSAASRPVHATCACGHAVAERAHDREADVAEEEARQRLDDARPEALLARRPSCRSDRGRRASASADEHRREQEDARRLRRGRHHATDAALAAHLRADGDGARQIVDGEPAPEAGMRGVEPDRAPPSRGTRPSRRR